MPSFIKDLSGQTFGTWKVLHFAERTNGTTFFCCQCTCGTIKDVAAGNLTSGRSTGCPKCRIRKNDGLRRYQEQRKTPRCPKCKKRNKRPGQSICAVCANAYQRERRAQWKASDPVRYQRHLERIRHSNRQWWANRTPAQRAYQRERRARWYQRRKEMKE